MAEQKKTVDVKGIQKAAQTYDRMLRTLPYFSFEKLAKALLLNVKEVEMENIITHQRRRAGITQAYKPGNIGSYAQDIIAFESSSLKVAETVTKTKDNIHNYDDVDVQFLGGKPVDNTARRHPLEYRLLKALVKSHLEDICFAAFNGERDENSESAAASIDGVYTKVDALQIAGELTAARGNFAYTGAFNMPVDENDTSAYEQLVEFIGGAHDMLRTSWGGTPQLLAAMNVLKAARAALRNKLKAIKYPTMEETLAHLREDALAPDLLFNTHPALGLGGRLIMQKVGNIDLGWNTKKASNFVLIRDIYEDPNDFQFWLQAAYGTRIIDWHEKKFRTNEQTNEMTSLAGDYCTTGAVVASLGDAPAAARWYVDGKVQQRSNGQAMLGLAPGTYTIKFVDVEGYTTPADQEVTVKAGVDTKIEAAYVSK